MNIELRRWLTGCYDGLEDLAPHDQRELGLTAMNFDFILQSEEWTEETFRRALESEYQKALTPHQSKVS